jgi:hypothetical protein
MTDEQVIDRPDLSDAVARVIGEATVDPLELMQGDNSSLEKHLERIQRH